MTRKSKKSNKKRQKLKVETDKRLSKDVYKKNIQKLHKLSLKIIPRISYTYIPKKSKCVFLFG